jgi:hypothetical protein
MIFNKYNNYKEFSDDKINLEQLTPDEASVEG